ncbi:Methyltransf 12 multi-domain protein [Pyrenophora teres f. maculata]|nr:Methyltransf 12 multi-domain protein [Pyrenophora teres f. maculata]
MHSSPSIDVHKPHLASYKQWLLQQHTPNLGDTDTAALSQPIETLMKVLEVTPAARAALAITAISNSMEAVLEGEKTGWEVMNDNGSLNSLTAFLQEHDDSEYIWSIAHTKLNMSVLEVGAGDGEKTSRVVTYLTHANGQPLYSQLVVTDASLNNLNAMKEDFKGVPRVKFSVIDVGGSLAEQGFESQQFNLIIAISTDNDIQASLKTLHQLLRPNGRLILQEPRPGLLWAKFSLGTQPDWWSHVENLSRIEEPFSARRSGMVRYQPLAFFKLAIFRQTRSNVRIMF